MTNELKKSGATNFVVEKTSQWREKIPLFVGCTQDNISLFGQCDKYKCVESRKKIKTSI